MDSTSSTTISLNVGEGSSTETALDTSILPVTPSPTFPLLALPPEIRKNIFECFFRPHRVTIQCRDPKCPIDFCNNLEDEDSRFGRLALTRTSKLIRLESIFALLRVATFDFQLLDHHHDWKPSDALMVHIRRMKNMYGPPRLLHHLGITTLTWHANLVGQARWLDNCAADHIVCDMIIDNFDIEDAIKNGQSLEGQYFEGVRKAIAGPTGSKLTLCIQVEDGEPTWNAWDESHKRSGIQVWKQKVIVRRKPRTEAGKLKLSNALTLLGLELKEGDKKIIELKKVDTGDVQNSDIDHATGAVDNGNDSTGEAEASGKVEVGQIAPQEDPDLDDVDDDSARRWWNTPDDDDDGMAGF